MDPKNDKLSKNMQVRMSESDYAAVVAEATRRKVQLSDYLRSVLLQNREGTESGRLAEIERRLADQDRAIVALAEALRDVRVGLALGFQAVLVDNNKGTDHASRGVRDSAREWVRENLWPEDLPYPDNPEEANP